VSAGETRREGLLSVREVARALGVSPFTVYRRVRDGSLEAVRVGEAGPLRVTPAAVRALLRPARAAEEQTR
jgi:excisionase family DNA binding protein